MKQQTNSEQKPKKEKTLKERVKKHLNDKNDVITEEDLKNIKVGEEATDDSKDENDAESMAKALEEKKVTSPWTILSEEDK